MPTKTRSKTRTDKYQATTDKILKLLESGVKPWVKPWSATPYQNLVTNHVYRGCNPLILTVDMMLNDWKKPYFVGFGQAKNNNWKIIRGSKGTHILFASSYTKKTKDEQGEETELTGYAHKWFNVFNVACLDDTESDNKISSAIDKIQESLPINTDSPIQKVETFINSQNAQVTFGGDRAYYSPKLDQIRMPEFKHFSSTKKYYCTFLHELTHRTGHPNRLDRDMSGTFGTQKYAYEELIAELGSAFVSNELMLNWDLELEHHASYLDSWLSLLKNDNRAFFKAASAAAQAADFLFNNYSPEAKI